MSDLPLRWQPCEPVEELADELREAITQDGIYPWNPADPEAEAYFAELEQDFSLTDCLDSEEVETQAEAFFNHLHQCWETENERMRDEKD